MIRQIATPADLLQSATDDAHAGAAPLGRARPRLIAGPVMKAFAGAAFVALAMAALSPAANAQTAATALPPGGQTIAGPGVMVGAGTRTVWTSASPLGICVTVVAPPGASSSQFAQLTLLPSNITTPSFFIASQALTLCANNQTSVSIRNSTGSVIYRVDRTN